MSEQSSPPEERFGHDGHYGLELVVDMKGCRLADLSREMLGDFIVELVDRVDMVRHGDPMFWEDHSGIPHLDGISAIQFIQTSNVVVHALPILEAVYLNLFSCKAFDTGEAIRFCKDYWGAESANHTVLTRQ